MLLRIYAKCVVGQDEIAKRRISEALGLGRFQDLRLNLADQRRFWRERPAGTHSA